MWHCYQSKGAADEQFRALQLPARFGMSSPAADQESAPSDLFRRYAKNIQTSGVGPEAWRLLSDAQHCRSLDAVVFQRIQGTIGIG